MHNHTQDHRLVQNNWNSTSLGNLGGVPFFCFRINISKFPLEGKFGEGNHIIWFNEPDRRASSFPLSQDAHPPHPSSKSRVPGHVGFLAAQPGAGLSWALGFCSSQARHKKPIGPRVVVPGASYLGAAGPGGLQLQSGPSDGEALDLQTLEAHQVK